MAISNGPILSQPRPALALVPGPSRHAPTASRSAQLFLAGLRRTCVIFWGPTSSMQRVLITRPIESLWLTILVLSLIPIPGFQDQSRPGRAPMIDPKFTISPIQDA
jgi:hypothetical protein